MLGVWVGADGGVRSVHPSGHPSAQESRAGQEGGSHRPFEEVRPRRGAPRGPDGLPVLIG